MTVFSFGIRTSFRPFERFCSVQTPRTAFERSFVLIIFTGVLKHFSISNFAMTNLIIMRYPHSELSGSHNRNRSLETVFENANFFDGTSNNY